MFINYIISLIHASFEDHFLFFSFLFSFFFCNHYRVLYKFVRFKLNFRNNIRNKLFTGYSDEKGNFACKGLTTNSFSWTQFWYGNDRLNYQSINRTARQTQKSNETSLGAIITIMENDS